MIVSNVDEMNVEEVVESDRVEKFVKRQFASQPVKYIYYGYVQQITLVLDGK